MKTDGTVVQKITAPGEAGFKQANEWRVTGFVPGPDGSIYIAIGYGDSRILRFDKHETTNPASQGRAHRGREVRLQSPISRGCALRSAAAACLRSGNFRLSHFDLTASSLATSRSICGVCARLVFMGTTPSSRSCRVGLRSSTRAVRRSRLSATTLSRASGRITSSVPTIFPQAFSVQRMGAI